MIVPVWMSHRDTPEKEVLVYGLLDTQSDTTFVLDKTLKTLGVSGPKVELSLSTMHAENSIVQSRRISGLQVRAYNEPHATFLPTTYSRDVMPANRDHIPTPSMARQWSHLERVSHLLMPLNQNSEVGLLIGYNCPKALVPREVIPPVLNGPYAQRTDLGWGIVGIIDKEQDDIETDAIGVSHRILTHVVHNSLSSDGLKKSVRFSFRTSVKEILTPVKQMLETDFSEGKSGTTALSQEDRKFLQTLETEIVQRGDDHYEMPLPFRNGIPNLPNNKPMALHRLRQLKKRLSADSNYRRDYCEFMKSIIQNGYAEQVTESSSTETGVWYIPHHGVYHPQKPGKIRVVFDCSAKYRGGSLNDNLLQGPDLTNTDPDLRQEPIAILCDIEKMFFQFYVKKEHCDFLRFLWWDSGNPNCDIAEYRMNVHLFGAVSSPGCANDNEQKFGKEAADFIRQDFYVDDGLKSVPTVEAALKLISDSKGICSNAGLRLHKFLSNSKEVLSSIPLDERSSGVKNLDLSRDNLPIERALGVQWCVESDSFCFRITLKDQPLTRRGILSTIGSVYDPLGFIAPVILAARQILQQMCRENAHWDDPLPEELRSQWAQWRSTLPGLKDFKIPRCLKPDGFGKVQSSEIDHFSDASTYGYGQCSYLRLTDEDGRVHCSFLMGKARVAPIRNVTIPRLELTAALVSAKVSTTLQRELSCVVNQELFWTDSKVVLWYITNDVRRFHVFVANRVQQIKDVTTTSQWNYVPTGENPADHASRGLSPEKMMTSSWSTGPKFLWLPSYEKSNITSVAESIEDDPEVKMPKGTTFSTSVQESFSSGETVLNRLLERFSCWTSCCRLAEV